MYEKIADRRLIDGPVDELMAISPLKHPWADDVWEKFDDNFWTKKVVDLTSDVRQYRHDLTDAERTMYNKSLAFLSNLDGIQFNNLTTNIAKYVTSPEVSMVIQYQAQQEGNHVRAYATMIETMAIDPAEIYMQYESDPILASKNSHILTCSRLVGTHYSPTAFALAVVANIVLEGVYFYSGFLAFYTLARSGKMLGSASMIKYIQRDELAHLYLFKMMYMTLKTENPEIFTPEFYGKAIEVIRSGAELEKIWGRHIIPSEGVMGMTGAITDGHIETRANKCALTIGLPEVYPGIRNPVEWFDEFSKVNSAEANQFESRPTNYKVGGALAW